MLNVDKNRPREYNIAIQRTMATADQDSLLFVPMLHCHKLIYNYIYMYVCTSSPCVSTMLAELEQAILSKCLGEESSYERGHSSDVRLRAIQGAGG